MFNFQKEVVLNNLNGVEVVSAPAKGHPSTSGTGFDKKFRVHGGGEYFGKYFVDNKYYYTNPIEGVMFELVIKSQSLANKHVQIVVELGLDSDYRGDFGSAVWYFRKPLLVDLDLSGVASSADVQAMVGKAFETVVPKEYKLVKISKNDDDTVITGADSALKVRSVSIKEIGCSVECGESRPDEIVAVHKYVPTQGMNNTHIKYKANNVEFGTYNYLIHNLRLPTYENMRFSSLAAVEMPTHGAKYVQVSFAYCVPRSISFGGLSVAGQQNHSTTLHTFYVAENIYNDFKAKLEELGVTGVQCGRNGDYKVTILPDQYASAQDLKAASVNESQASDISKKADANDVYTKDEADKKFAKK